MMVIGIKKFAVVFALMLAVFSFLYFLILGQNSSIVGGIVASFVTGIVAFFLLQLLLLPVQRSLNNIVSDCIDKHTDLIAYAPINHSKKYYINATGGVGCLFKDKLVFVPHTMNLSRKELTLFFCEIESISDYRVWGIFDTGLNIVLKSGRTEKFIINKTSQFYKDLFNIFHAG